MSDHHESKPGYQHRIYSELLYPVLTIKIFLQILIGAGLIIAIIINIAAVIGFIEIGGEADPVQWVKLAAEAHPLRIIAYGLAASAALELAFMLFTPGPDEAVEPLLQGIAASSLYYVSVLVEKNETQWHNFLLLAVLLGGIPLMFWVRERFIHGIIRTKNAKGS